MFYKTMTYCPECEHPLEKKFLKDEGDIPYCSQCNSFRFPVFNTAISAILFNESHDKILLIKQYKMTEHILLAGYVSQGENAEATVAREIDEELGLKVKSLTFNVTKYYERSNSLMINFAATVTGAAKLIMKLMTGIGFQSKMPKKPSKMVLLPKVFY
ncbi:NUDIX domain-containing protein [Streptococcus infantarius]|uniref:NUDIX domain-containing protein n=1 Tax=Streptococcus infantarius TaxID=102684 RepID=UPI002FD8489B